MTDSQSPDSARPDLNSPQRIHDFVASFYERVLADETLAPIFVQTANIELRTHLPLIESFWRKLLLGDPGYERHMINIHREIDQRHAFSAAHFQRWLQLFETTLDAGYQGPVAERARQLARSIAGNLQEALLAPTSFTTRTRPIADRATPIRKPEE